MTVTSLLDNMRWAFTVRGLVALAIGVLALVWPATALTALVYLFGVYVLADGIVLVAAAIRGGASQRWLIGLQGLVGIMTAIVLFVAPQGVAVVAVYVFGAWA